MLGRGQAKGAIYVTSMLCMAVEREREEQKTTKGRTKEGPHEAICGKTRLQWQAVWPRTRADLRGVEHDVRDMC